MIHTPGIYTQEQVEGWKPVIKTVHDNDGVIVCQLWHMGRQSHSSFQPNGGLPVSASATPIKESSTVMTTSGEKVKFETPRALETDEIPRIVSDYAHAAQFAKDAGFDGVELHAANGYLMDQFFHDSVNKRTDQYGGSIENRARIVFMVIEALINVWGPDRVGIRISPPVYLDDSDKPALYEYIVRKLDTYNLAYLHLVNGLAYDRLGIQIPEADRRLNAAYFRPMYKGVIIDCGQYDRASAIAEVASGASDMVAFGRPFISNPDLRIRIEKDKPLAPADPSTYFTQGLEGYTDYPTYEEAEQKKACAA